MLSTIGLPSRSSPAPSPSSSSAPSLSPLASSWPPAASAVIAPTRFSFVLLGSMLFISGFYCTRIRGKSNGATAVYSMVESLAAETILAVQSEPKTMPENKDDGESDDDEDEDDANGDGYEDEQEDDRSEDLSGKEGHDGDDDDDDSEANGEGGSEADEDDVDDSKIAKIINNLHPFQCNEAMNTIIYQSNMGAHGPVGDCYHYICNLEYQLKLAPLEPAPFATPLPIFA